ncbi:hypothetical protein D3835_08530 [Streptococcus mutans]|nr:hypothetical protein SMU33_03151 [Streptococcus mutans 11SSST2]EMC29365.1 hypothetical protein SMU85_02641 [Streptococcus mutans ST6]EMC50285.1 hypothetical protein SMU102_05024 [Streptococcus mutans S1B]NLQ77057.1 hypothetical protein [Streptococcus mutans]
MPYPPFLTSYVTTIITQKRALVNRIQALFYQFFNVITSNIFSNLKAPINLKSISLIQSAQDAQNNEKNSTFLFISRFDLSQDLPSKDYG